MICGILYVLHEGTRWRALPTVFGCFSSVYTRFSRWEKRGLLKHLFEITAAAGSSGNERSLDASHIKVHQDANTKAPENEAMGMTRGGRNSKLHAVVDSAGHAVRLSLTAGQVNDCTQASLSFRLIIFCLLITAARWAVTAFYADNFGIMLLAQSTHAFGFAVFHACCMYSMGRLFPGHLAKAGQSLMYGFSSGIGGVLGAVLASWMWDVGKGDAAFLASAAVSLMACVLFVTRKEK